VHRPISCKRCSRSAVYNPTSSCRPAPSPRAPRTTSISQDHNSAIGPPAAARPCSPRHSRASSPCRSTCGCDHSHRSRLRRSRTSRNISRAAAEVRLLRPRNDTASSTSIEIDRLAAIGKPPITRAVPAGRAQALLKLLEGTLPLGRRRARKHPHQESCRSTPQYPVHLRRRLADLESSAIATQTSGIGFTSRCANQYPRHGSDLFSTTSSPRT